MVTSPIPSRIAGRTILRTAARDYRAIFLFLRCPFSLVFLFYSCFWVWVLRFPICGLAIWASTESPAAIGNRDDKSAAAAFTNVLKSFICTTEGQLLPSSVGPTPAGPSAAPGILGRIAPCETQCHNAQLTEGVESKAANRSNRFSRLSRETPMRDHALRLEMRQEKRRPTSERLSGRQRAPKGASRPRKARATRRQEGSLRRSSR